MKVILGLIGLGPLKVNMYPLTFSHQRSFELHKNGNIFPTGIFTLNRVMLDCCDNVSMQQFVYFYLNKGSLYN